MRFALPSGTIPRTRDSFGPSTGLATPFVTRHRAPRRTGTRVAAENCRFRVKWADGRVTLDEGEYVLGRDPDAEEIFLNSPGVSRRHARIRVSAGRATLEDLGSKNGTFVGDERVDGSESLCDGDVIGVGSVKLTLSVLQPPSSTETQPAGNFLR